MAYQAVMKDGRERYEKALGHLKDQLKRIRTGRLAAENRQIGALGVIHQGCIDPPGEGSGRAYRAGDAGQADAAY